jgi:DNA-binding phage protein
MPLTREFRTTVQERAQRDRAFRVALLSEAMECFLAGDVETGKSVLRNYINATVGFVALAEQLNVSPKSLMRMLGPQGNPRAANLFGITASLQDREHLRLRVTPAHA